MVICRCSNTPRNKLLVVAYVDDVLLSGPGGYPVGGGFKYFLFSSLLGEDFLI